MLLLKDDSSLPKPSDQIVPERGATWGVLKAQDSSDAISVKPMAKDGVFLSEIVG